MWHFIIFLLSCAEHEQLITHSNQTVCIAIPVLFVLGIYIKFSCVLKQEN